MGKIFGGLMAALLCAAPHVMAQRTVVVDVPFPFAVKDMMCPAGEWTFTKLEGVPAGAMIIRSTRTGESVVFLVQLESWDTRTTQAKAVFYRYGDRYFLKEVHEGTGITARLLPGEEERRLQVAGVKRVKTAVLAQLK